MNKEQLLKQMQKTNALRTKNIINAFKTIPRENFVLPNMKNQAYEDTALPLIQNQTISQPTTIAIMLELLQPKTGHNILEIGAGCGYVASLLSNIVGPKGQVHSIDIIPELVELAEQNIKKLEIKNVNTYSKDGKKGLPTKAPFDRILISAACPGIPKPLLDQLKNNGKIVAPIGQYSQTITVYTKQNEEIIKETLDGMTFLFVPLI